MAPRVGDTVRRFLGRVRNSSPVSTVGDAPIDPYDDPLSVSDLVARYPLLRADAVAESVAPFPRYGDGSSDLYVDGESIPESRLFCVTPLGHTQRTRSEC